MKRANREGPGVLAPEQSPTQLEAPTLREVAAEHMVIDTRNHESFAAGHVPGTVSIPLKYLAAWAGWLVDYDAPIYLLTPAQGDCTLAFHCRSGGRSAIAASLAQAAGVEKVVKAKGGINAWVRAGLPVMTKYHEVTGPHSDASTNDAANQSQAAFWEAKCPTTVAASTS